MSILQQTTNILEEIVQIRHHIHQHPELSNQEWNTTQLVSKFLGDLGIPHTVCESGVGVVGYLHIDEAAKTLAIRADMDALPILEATDVSFKSQNNGIMHACGHDMHTAVLLGTAKLLVENRHVLNCNVKFIFQPAEEILRGAKDMIAAGALDSPAVDAIVALHTSPDLSVGEIGIRYGAMLAAADSLNITIKGTGGHAAHPHKCVDPIIIAGHVLTSLQTIISREIPPTDSAVITIGQINGGEAHNIIPEIVTMKGTVRTTNPSIRQQMPKTIERVVQNIAFSMRGDADIEYTFGCPAVISDRNLLQLFEQSITELFEHNAIVHMPVPSMGGEDFAFFLEEVPGFMFRIGTGSDNPDSRRALHNHKVIFEDEAIYYGIASMTHFALTYK